MDKVLITGVNGFTGRYVKTALERNGYSVVGMVSSGPKEGQIACDLTDRQAVFEMMKIVRPDYIINLAAISFVGHEKQSEFYDVNVFGALNLLESAYSLDLPIKKIILSSSANIYGNPLTEKIDECQSPSPMNHYAMSKLAMEYMSRLWFEKLPIIITRPFNYTGPGQAPHFLIPKIIHHFQQKKTVIELGNTDVSRDFSDVRDISLCYVKLLASDMHSDVVNLCSGKVHSLDYVIKAVEEIARYKIEVKINPDFVRSNEIKILIGDNSKLFDKISFKPEISLKQTIIDMFNANNMQ